MTRRRFNLGLAALLGVGIVAITYAPEPTLIVLSIAIPITISGAILSAIYLRRVYRRQPKPRSRFFGMVIELFVGLVAVGAWVGYLTVARLIERANHDGRFPFTIPAPGPSHSAPISALIVIAVFASPIRFAVEVFLVRRNADRRIDNGGDVRELDRATETDEEV